jgi:predicted deacylase
VVGITCAIHGNKVNVIPIIQKLFNNISHPTTPKSTAGREQSVLSVIRGIVIAIPVLNVPGFLDSTRCFDGQDLNRLMPGKSHGAAPQQYAYQVFERLIAKLDYLIDLHTASAGRQNCLYVRADMSDSTIARLAELMQSDIVVHNSSPHGSLRGCAQSRGIKALMVEIGNLSIFQEPLIQRTYAGIRKILADLEMTSEIGARNVAVEANFASVVCSRSVEHPHPHRIDGMLIPCAQYWIITQRGGILHSRGFPYCAFRREWRLILSVESACCGP